MRGRRLTLTAERNCLVFYQLMYQYEQHGLVDRAVRSGTSRNRSLKQKVSLLNSRSARETYSADGPASR